VAGGRADTTLAVTNLRARAGPIASAWLGEPSLRLLVVAVTGTNGKTSCTHWIAAGCNAHQGNAGPVDANGTAAAARAVVIGTLGEGVPGRLDPSARLTTPDALELQQSLARFADAGIELVAIEASSIGLVQHRLDGTRIAVAVMTNLTRDHLDAHGTMADYAAAKGRLFDWRSLGAAVVNLDDPAAAAMLDRVAPGTRRIGYTIRADPSRPIAGVPSGIAAGDWIGAGEPAADGSFELAIGPLKRNVRLQVIGGFNRSNALAVAGVWHALGWTPDAIVRGLGGLQPVPGRLQMVGDVADGTFPLVVVDYAHTPDALANVLAALRPIAARRGGRLWCVFGAGGDRDRGKRAAMAAAVEAHADHVVLTSDNPRSEEPARILTDLEAGLARPARLVEPDRARAIGRAVLEAAAADIVLVAGKGHEDYQEIAGVRHPFSDVAVARSIYAARTGGRPLGDGDG
jgi:UDP-N-acetylmuramyl-tripeptide synthetase